MLLEVEGNYVLDIVFVILNFLTYDLTINCINSIRENLDTDKYHLIVVDNASTNESREFLKKQYSDDGDVTLIYNSRNTGYAAGNNTGIVEARKMKPKFICCINNDTCIISGCITSIPGIVN